MTNKAARVVSVWTLVVAWAVAGLGSGSVARGQFKCGNVFVAESSFKLCHEPPTASPDRIWELNPHTGEAKLFAVIPDELCTFLTGLAFTPDGTRLRASALLRNEIWEFDSEGNWTTVLGPADGIACPIGFNNLAYDAQGNFYVANDCGDNILRFPADGGPGTLFTSGTGVLLAMAFAADGDLYFTTLLNNFNRLMRVTPDGIATEFDNYGSIITGETLTADKNGFVYVALENGEILRYRTGNPASRQVFTTLICSLQCSMTMSPDQKLIYFHRGKELWTIDVEDGTTTQLLYFLPPPPLGPSGGIAVAPAPPCVSLSSQIALILTGVVLLICGTIAIVYRSRTVGYP